MRLCGVCGFAGSDLFFGFAGSDLFFSYLWSVPESAKPQLGNHMIEWHRPLNHLLDNPGHCCRL